ncbi:nuclear pore complex protein Nup50-like [Ixodes scapularis]|uniref:nuclear pore complex protein Nup50-like n=1 Tax=Ixodes scapularis TaxID=6945 RepID=UPI001C388114|nr:nuclear pore complex protein Nup50-like [Ixodes scapularis]
MRSVSNSLMRHFEAKHGIVARRDKLKFNLLKEFSDWREAKDGREHVRFILHDGPKGRDEGVLKRCKLFHKKGDGYVERGVGTLYVKSLNGRHQLLLRADTSLGNILLNILLAPTLPVSRLGKNNVALVCVPNPPMDPNETSPAPTTLLLRVRTAEDADELRDTLNRYKGQS